MQGNLFSFPGPVLETIDFGAFPVAEIVGFLGIGILGAFPVPVWIFRSRGSKNFVVALAIRLVTGTICCMF